LRQNLRETICHLIIGSDEPNINLFLSYSLVQSDNKLRYALYVNETHDS
jgi:hypothetical protein